MTINSHIRSALQGLYVTLKLNFTYKATQTDKRHYFSWLNKGNRSTVIANFILKIVMVPQQELRVLGGEKRLPALATFWRSKKKKTFLALQMV